MHQIFTHQHRTFSMPSTSLMRCADLRASIVRARSSLIQSIGLARPLRCGIHFCARWRTSLRLSWVTIRQSHLLRVSFVRMSTDPSLPDEIRRLVRWAVEDSSPIYKLRDTKNHTPTKLPDDDVVFADVGISRSSSSKRS